MTAICGMCPCHVCASWQSFLCIFYATFLFISLLRYFCFVFHSTFLHRLCSRNAEWKSMNCECWTGWMGKKIMVNVELKPEQWTAYKSYEVEVEEGPEIRMRVDKWIAAFIIHCVSSIPQTRPLFSMSPLKSFWSHFPSAVHYANKKLYNLNMSELNEAVPSTIGTTRDIYIYILYIRGSAGNT